MNTEKEKPTQSNKLHIINSAFWIFFAGLIVALDQISKWIVTEAIIRPNIGIVQNGLGFIEWYKNTPPPLPFINIEITSFFNLVMVWNKGVSFGMFSTSGINGPLLLMVLAGAITVFFLIWLFRTNDKLHGFCFSLVIGGAIGNIIDRARFGAVIDFLDFHAFGYHWPAFNIADMCVVSGVSLLVILSFVFDLHAKRGYRNPVS